MTKLSSELEKLRASNPVPEVHDPDWAESDTARPNCSRRSKHAPTQTRRRRSRVSALAGAARPSRSRSSWCCRRRRCCSCPAIVGDRVITVDAAEALADPVAVEAELAQQGIDADIRIVPANKTLAGKWFHLYFPPDSKIDEETFWPMKSYVGVLDARFDSVNERCPIGDCARTSILEIPGRVKGPMTLIVGREPQPGEEYWAHEIDWDNELAPSGALYCHRLEEKTPEEASALLQRLGYEVIWVNEEDKFSEEVAFPPPGRRSPSRSSGGPA